MTVLMYEVIFEEADIEKKLVALKTWRTCIKFTSPGNAGVPDRLVLLQGQVLFVETKAPGKRLRPLQRYWRRTLKQLGFQVHVVNSLESLERVKREILNLSGGGPFHG